MIAWRWLNKGWALHAKGFPARLCFRLVVSWVGLQHNRTVLLLDPAVVGVGVKEPPVFLTPVCDGAISVRCVLVGGRRCSPTVSCGYQGVGGGWSAAAERLFSVLCQLLGGPGHVVWSPRVTNIDQFRSSIGGTQTCDIDARPDVPFMTLESSRGT